MKLSFFDKYGTIFTCVSYAGRPSVCLSVRPSVRPSVTRWHPIKTAEYIVMLSSPHDSPFILVLCIPRFREIQMGSALAGALNTGRV